MFNSALNIKEFPTMNNQQGIQSFVENLSWGKPSQNPIDHGKAIQRHCGQRKTHRNISQYGENRFKIQSIWGIHFKARQISQRVSQSGANRFKTWIKTIYHKELIKSKYSKVGKLEVQLGASHSKGRSIKSRLVRRFQHWGKPSQGHAKLLTSSFQG